MARFYADLPLPVAAACYDSVAAYAKTQQADGDDRPIGQIRTEILTDLILRPWDTTRPPVTAEVTIHLTIPILTGSGGSGGDGGSTGGASSGSGRTGVPGLHDNAAQADVDGHTITAAQCRELLTQLHSSRLFLALHGHSGGLHAVASHSQLKRAARHRRCGGRSTGSAKAGTDGAELRPPAATPNYRPTRTQDRHVRTRDRTCRHFGCTRKAVHADLDHHQRHPDGPTAVCNLCCYCRTHHRLKHQAPGWTRHFQPDGTLTISTPTAITRTTRPAGAEPDWPLPALTAIDSGQPTPVTTPHDDPPPF